MSLFEPIFEALNGAGVRYVVVRVAVVLHGNTRFTANLVLYNIVKDRAKVIAKSEGELQDLNPGQVSGDFVVWDQATFNNEGSLSACNVFRYRISTGRTTRIDNPNQQCQCFPKGVDMGTSYAVDLTGGGVNVYYDRYTCSNLRADIYVETLP